MAVSPLLPPPATDAAASTSSPLKRQLSAMSSGNGTPTGTTTKPAKSRPAGVPTDDLEQMNRAEANKYVTTKFLGEGTYAIVHRGHERADPSQVVAIKMIKVQKDTDGMAPDAVRELKHLQELSHPNIIALKSVYSANGQNLCLVLEYLPLGDLEMLIRDTHGIAYSGADIKAWMGMLGRAVWFCHENYVLHRDIKPNNLLIAADGEVKLADFGLARSFADPNRGMTSNVITRWYRPPELLYGTRHYSGAVDVWSVGCVFAELILRRPYLPGDAELHQISLICEALGTPTEENWPGVTKLDQYVAQDKIVPVPKKEFMNEMFGFVGDHGVDLLMKTLILDPRKRITAKGMLLHPWWAAAPRPTSKADLPRKRTGAEQKIAADLKRPPGALDDDSSASGGNRGNKVARKLDFGGMK